MLFGKTIFVRDVLWRELNPNTFFSTYKTPSEIINSQSREQSEKQPFGMVCKLEGITIFSIPELEKQ